MSNYMKKSDGTKISCCFFFFLNNGVYIIELCFSSQQKCEEVQGFPM